MTGGARSAASPSTFAHLPPTPKPALRSEVNVHAPFAGPDPQAAIVVDAARQVHDALGPGFTEIAYQRALAIELAHRGVPFAQEAQLDLTYRGETLGVPFRVDFVCYRDLLVELKAVPFLGPIQRLQLRHYLRLAGSPAGLLVNFGKPELDVERVLALPGEAGLAKAVVPETVLGSLA